MSDVQSRAPERSRRRTGAVETMEITEAGGILGVAQKAIEQAVLLAERGSRTAARPHTREKLRAAKQAADEAQRAINAELSIARLAVSDVQRPIKVGSEWVRGSRMRCRVTAITAQPGFPGFERVDYERLDPVKRKRDWAVAERFLRYWETADA